MKIENIVLAVAMLVVGCQAYGIVGQVARGTGRAVKGSAAVATAPVRGVARAARPVGKGAVSREVYQQASYNDSVSHTAMQAGERRIVSSHSSRPLRAWYEDGCGRCSGYVCPSYNCDSCESCSSCDSCDSCC